MKTCISDRERFRKSMTDMVASQILILSMVVSGMAGSFTSEKVDPFSRLLSSQLDVGNSSGTVNYTFPLDSVMCSSLYTLPITLHYSSNIWHAVRADNATIPTGMVGLGWYLGFGSIICEHQNTKTHNDDIFSWKTPQGFTVRMDKDASGGWHIRRFPYIRCAPVDETGDGIYDKWELTTTEGVKFTYGGKNVPGDEQHATRFTFAAPSPGEYVGEVYNVTPELYPYQWDCASVSDPNGNAIKFYYMQISDAITSESWNSGSIRFTRESYPVRIVGPHKQTIVFHYGDKTIREYYRRDYNAFIKMYETQYLDSLSVYAGTSKIRKYFFSYDSINQYKTGMGGNDLFYKKRILKTIDQVGGVADYYNDINFITTRETRLTEMSYVTDESNNLGALKAVTHPTGLTEKLTYTLKNLQPENLKSYSAQQSPDKGIFQASQTSDGKPYNVYGTTATSYVTYLDGVTWKKDLLCSDGGGGIIRSGFVPVQINVYGDIIVLSNSQQVRTVVWNGDSWTEDARMLAPAHAIQKTQLGKNYLVVENGTNTYLFDAYVRQNGEWKAALVDKNIWPDGAANVYDVKIQCADRYFVAWQEGVAGGSPLNTNFCVVFRFNGPKTGTFSDFSEKSVSIDKNIRKIILGPEFFVVGRQYIDQAGNPAMLHQVHVVRWLGTGWVEIELEAGKQFGHLSVDDIVCGKDFFVAADKSVIRVQQLWNSNSWTAYDYKPFTGSTSVNCDTTDKTYLAVGDNFFAVGRRYGTSRLSFCVSQYEGFALKVYTRKYSQANEFQAASLYTPTSGQLTRGDWICPSSSCLTTGNSTIAVYLRGIGANAAVKSVKMWMFDGKSWNLDGTPDEFSQDYGSEYITSAGSAMFFSQQRENVVHVRLKYQDSFGTQSSIQQFAITEKTLYDETYKKEETIQYDYADDADHKSAFDFISGIPLYNKVSELLPENGKTVKLYFNHTTADGQNNLSRDYEKLDSRLYGRTVYNNSDHVVASDANSWVLFRKSGWPLAVFDERNVSSTQKKDGVSVVTTIDKFNDDNGLFESRSSTTPEGIRRVTQVKYAYSDNAYKADMGPAGSNMLVQVCRTLTQSKTPSQINPVTISANAVTWSKSLGCSGRVPYKRFVWNVPKNGETPTKSFTDYNFADGASNPSWDLTDSSGRYDKAGYEIQGGKAAATTETRIYRNDNHLIIGTVKAGSFRECGIFTGDYKASGSIYYWDYLNGWERGTTNTAELVSYISYGDNLSSEKIIHVKNDYAAGRNNRVYPGKGYVMTAWVKVVQGTINMATDFRYAATNDETEWPVQSITTDPSKGSASATPVSADDCNGQWKLMKMEVPQSLTSRLEANKVWYARAWIGNDPSAPSFEAYVSDIRFVPAEALVKTYHYDTRNNQSRVTFDENVVPQNMNDYDGFGVLLNRKKVQITQGKISAIKAAEIHEYGMYHQWPADGVESSSGDVVPLTLSGKPVSVGRTEVTQADFVSVRGFNTSATKGQRLPMTNISFYDAILYCNARSKAEGLDTVYTYTGVPVIDLNGNCSAIGGFIKENQSWTGKNGYRLPTSAEWSSSYQAGTSRIYYWTDATDAATACNTAGAYEWYGGTGGNANNVPHEVAQKSSNDFGLHDMAGNVREWVWRADLPQVNGGSYYSPGCEELRYNFQTVGPTGNFYNAKNYPFGFRIVRN